MKRRLAAAAVFAALFAFAAAWVLHAQKSYPDASEMRAHMEEGKCADCHQEIWKEWEASGHAQAWESKLYQKLRAQYEDAPKACDPCHAPQPILITGAGAKLTKENPYPMPLLRSEGKKSGVDCLTCHLDADGAMKGPYSDPSPFHKTKASNVYFTRQIQLCGSCHGQPKVAAHNQVKDRAEGSRETCQQCHMPETQRKPSQYSAEIKRSASHAFLGSRSKEFLQSAYYLDYETTEEGVQLYVTNAADHPVPAAPLREIELQVQIAAADGAVLHDARETYRHPLDEGGKPVQPGAKDMRLKANETRVIAVPVNRARLKGAKLNAAIRYRRTADDPWVLMTELAAPLN